MRLQPEMTLKRAQLLYTNAPQRQRREAPPTCDEEPAAAREQQQRGF